MATCCVPDEGFLDGKRPSIDDLRSEIRALRRRCRELERKATDGGGLHYKTISEVLPDFVFVIERDGKVAYANHIAAEFLGIPADRIEGMKHAELFPPDVARQQWSSIEKVFSSGQPHQEEMTFSYVQGQRRQETRLFPIRDDSGETSAVLGICRDVTGMRNAQKALKQSESLFGAVFESASDAVLLMDDSGRFVAANPSSSEMLGLQKEEILRITLWDLVPEGIGSPMHDDWISTLSKGSGGWAATLRLLDGSDLPCRCHMRVGVVPGLNMLTISPAPPAAECPPPSMPPEAAAMFDLLEGVDASIWSVDPDYRLMAFNASFARGMEASSGHRPRAGDLLRDYSPDEDTWNEWRSIFERALHGESLFFVRNLPLPGEPMPAEFRFRPLRTSEGDIMGAVGLVTALTDVRQAGRALEASERRYRELVESLRSGVAVLQAFNEASDFKFVELNQSASKILDIEREQAVGKALTVLLPSAGDTGLAEALARVWRTGRTEALTDFLYRDGRIEFWAACTIYRIASGDVVLVFDDISDRKKAEEARRSGEELFHAIFEESPDPISLFDAEGRLVRSNSSAVSFLQVAGASDVEGLDLFSSPPLTGDLKERILRGETVHFQIPLDFDLARAMGLFGSSRAGVRYVDATVAPLRDPSGSLQGYVLHTRDETDRYGAEHALREKEERFRLVFQQSPVGIEVYDRDGRLIEMNSACLDLYGIEKTEEMIGFDLLGDPEMPEDLKEQIRGGQSVRFETTVDFDDITRDGVFRTSRTGVCHLDMVVNPLMKPDGTIAGYLVHSMDITKRKTAEQAFQQGEVRYRTMFESSPLGIFEATLEGKALRANDAYARLLGFDSTQELVAQVTDAAAQIYVDPDRRQQVVKTVLEEPGTHYFENDYRRRDGTTFMGGLVMQAVRDSEGTPLYLFGFVQDVTERKRAEEALRENEQRYRLVVQTQRELVSRWLPDTTLTFVNNAYARFHGLSPDELVGRKWIDLVPDAEKAFLAPRYSDLAANPRVMETEYTQKAADGSMRWFHWTDVPVHDDDGFLVEFQSVGWDMTDSRAAEEARQQSEESFRSLVELAPDAIFVSDEMGRFLEVNPAACAQLGYARDELLSKTLLDITSAEFIDRTRQRLSTPSQQPGVFESGLTRIDGALIDVEIGSQKVVYRGSSAMLGVARDITERRRAEEERKKLEAKMQQAQKLECLGVLAGGIAHDFNNLLMVMLGHANLAARQTQTLSPVKENIREIERAAQRAAELCRQMLAYSGKGRGQTQRVHLRDLIEEMANMLDVSISKKAVLRFDFADGLPQIDADPSQLRQVIMNLILNASEAVGERSGVITISTGASYCDKAALADVWSGTDLPEGLYVHVEVADTGCGMDADTVSKVFDPFFTTKFAGRGLGLAAVLGIVKGHNGAVLVKSEPGKGTVFRVLLPPATGSEPAHKHAAGRAHKETALSGMVLLADDEETVRALERSMLEALGCEVVMAQDGRDAVEIMRSRGSEIDCVLLDLTMPHMNGIEAVSELRRLGWETPIVVCTGYDSAEVDQSFAGLDISGVVQKPFDLAALGDAVRKAMKTGRRR